MDPSSPSEQKEIIDEVYGFIKVFSDGSVERPAFGGFVPACTEFVQGVATKDVTIDVNTGVWVRIFLPECVVSSNKKAPIVLHFHPGALCMGTPSAAVFHAFCSKMASQSASIWVSVDYQLAPEHPLPAAYDDAYASFMWLHAQSIMQISCTCGNGSLHGHDTCTCGNGYGLPCVHRSSNVHKTSLDALPSDVTHLCGYSGTAGSHISAHSPDPWLCEHADFSNCFLAGESSGGAIVHYLTMRIVLEEWSRIQIRGLLMIHAAFLIEGFFDTSFDATKERRPGTLRRLCLPPESEWDHPLVNPLHAQAPRFTDVVIPPCVVAVADLDKLCAPAKHYADVMEQCGQRIELYVTEGKGHCFYLRDSKSKESELLLQHLVAFILGRTSV